MSAPPHPRSPVETLREAVRAAVDATSLRAVASEVGMSEAWVRRLLSSGLMPTPRTLRKLEEWHVRKGRDRADDALDALLEGVTDVHRGQVRERLLEVLREAHRRAGTHPPGWLAGS